MTNGKDPYVVLGVSHGATEEEVKAAFLRVVNRVIANRKEILRELRSVRDTLTGTEELEEEQKRLAGQMNVDADAVQEAIAQNARVVQDQAEYSVRTTL